MREVYHEGSFQSTKGFSAPVLCLLSPLSFSKITTTLILPQSYCSFELQTELILVEGFMYNAARLSLSVFAVCSVVTCADCGPAPATAPASILISRDVGSA